MYLNKNAIKIISSLLIIFTIFTFSVVLAVDDSVYVWSSESKPLTENTVGEDNSKKEAVVQNILIENNVEETSAEVDDEKSKKNENEKNNGNSLNLESGGAILIEQKTGKVLYEHNPHEKLRPASVTKIMSILLIMEALDSGQISLDDKVPCTEDAAGMGGSQIWLEVGEELTVDEMLKAICVVSRK